MTAAGDARTLPEVMESGTCLLAQIIKMLSVLSVTFGTPDRPGYVNLKRQSVAHEDPPSSRGGPNIR